MQGIKYKAQGEGREAKGIPTASSLRVFESVMMLRIFNLPVFILLTQ
jgi:hypothetical protein